MQPLVSILIPAFNSETWVGEAIKSALNQTWPRKEIILVDDGSSDRTLLVARGFASETVRVVTQANQGAAAARNHALALSQGNYIQWLDADDLLAPDKIARQMAAVERDCSARNLLSSEWGYFVYRAQKAEFIPTPLWCDLSPVEWLLRKLEQNLFMQTGTWLVSRELTEASGPWDTRLLVDDDGEYFCRVIKVSEGIRFVPEARTLYRRSGSGRLSHLGCSEGKLKAQLLSMQMHIEHLRSLEDSPRVRVACLKYLQKNLIYFYPERPALTEQIRQLAASLGGKLGPPALSWKYSWIQKVFGWSAAKWVQAFYNECKSWVNREWDRALFEMEQRR